MERLRYVAGAGRLEHELLVQESAGSLAALAGDPAALLLSCKRLLQRHPSSGPLWWLCARMLCSDDPRREGRRCARELSSDETPRHLEAELPEAGVVTVLGWPELGASVLARRGDLRVLVVDAGGEGDELASRLRLLGADAVSVSDRGVSAAVLASDAVVLEAGALGAGGFVAVAGSRAAAAVARHAGLPVWVVAGVGRVVPAGAWAALAGRLAGAEPWSADEELVPLELADVLVRPAGRLALPGHVVPDFPEVPELL